MTEEKLNNVLNEGGDIEISIPEELRGHGIVVNYGASWISNLRVNDSNNTVTGTVAANSSTSSRSTTITLTASGNLSTTSLYSFTLTQSGRTQSCKVGLRFEGTGFIYAIFVKQNGKIIYTTSGLNLPSIQEVILYSPNWTFPSSGNITFEYNRTGSSNKPDKIGTVSPSSLTFTDGGNISLTCTATS